MYSLKLVIEKYAILNAMNLLVKSMNNEEAYERWIYTVPDQASEDDLMSIAADEDETVFCEACQDFRRICHDYLDDGIFAGCYPGDVKLYGAKKDDPYAEDEDIEKRIEELLAVANESGTTAAAGYDAGWYNGMGEAYETVLKMLKEA